MDFYENGKTPPNKIYYESEDIFNKRQLLYDESEILDRKRILQEKNESKLTLRKKKVNEHLNKFRKEKLKRMEIYCNTNNSMNYNEIINNIPNEIITEFNNCKNKYKFYINYLSLPDEKDPNFYIRMFTIYQIHNFLYNDVTNSSRPSPDLENCILKYLVYDYKNEHLSQKIKIQNQIIQMIIIWNSYTDEDDTNNVIYDSQFIYFLFDLLDNINYSIEFKINILILFNIMIKGMNTYNKIILNYEIINKIEKILGEIKSNEHFIYVLSLIDTIFKYEGKYEEEDHEIINNNKVIIFMNSYEKLFILFKNFYEKYQVIYEQLKKEKTSLLLDNSVRIYYKIIIKLLQIFNDSMFLENNTFYLNSIMSNGILLPLFYKILEIFSKDFFITFNNNNFDNSSEKFKITDNIYIEKNKKSEEKNNLYKKFKVLEYLTNILSEIISNISEKDKELTEKGNKSQLILEFIKQINFINYYSNLLKNFICLNIKPDNLVILRIEELLYNFCFTNKTNFNILYKNYDLIRDLLSINLRYYNEVNFGLIIKFIISSLSLYDTEITNSLIFDIKIIDIFFKYLENEINNKEKNKDNISYVLYALNRILNVETYRKCKVNRNLIIYEFNKNNSNEILEQYSLILNDEKDEENYLIINEILSNLDETDILDNNQIEDIFN